MQAYSSIAVVDPDPKSSSRIARTLNGLGYHAEPYASVAELKQHWPATSLLLVRDCDELAEQILANMLPERNWLPIVVFGSEPTAMRVCDMLFRGAIGFLAEPIDAVQVTTYLERPDARLQQVMMSARRRSDAARKVSRLSGREREVLRLLAVGDSNKLIADRLSISPRTVEIHRANMIRKIGARGTSDAIRIAVDCNLDTLVEG
jgi:two-component system, LuxR family, response regulator FixJ